MTDDRFGFECELCSYYPMFAARDSAVAAMNRHEKSLRHHDAVRRLFNGVHRYYGIVD